MSDAPEQYCRALLGGLDTVQAAREAGYASRPPRQARELWERVEVLQGEAVDVAQMQAEADALECKLRRLQVQMREMRQWLRAALVVKG